MGSNVKGLQRVRRRSVGFLEREGESWACFLVTYRDDALNWHGYFSFRPREGDASEDEIRTADIFLEESEEEIDRKARGLGRPLLGGLLASALHTAGRYASGRSDGASPELRKWFREMLTRHSLELVDDGSVATPDPLPDGSEGIELGRTGSGRSEPEKDRSDRSEPRRSAPLLGRDGVGPDLTQMRSLYESYRMDQVAHFISLVEPVDFERAVDRILDGRPFDFGARDRLQFAMIVVEYIEERLPLPPFEAWLEDFVEHRDAYRLYAHTLHRKKRLP